MSKMVVPQAICRRFKLYINECIGYGIIKLFSPLPRGRGCDSVIIRHFSFIRGAQIFLDPIKSKPVFNYKSRTEYTVSVFT